MFVNCTNEERIDLMKSNRELAAILFTDVSDFTRTMDTDENLAMDQVLRHKEIVSRLIQNYNGHLIKDMGDGLFVKFASAVESVQCAINIQQLINVENFSIRIGIHLGEIIIKNNDVFGSGVNIASRIHTASHPGSICISKEIWRQVKNQDDIHSKSLGKKAFKGVEEKIEVFELLNDKSSNINSMKYNKSFSYMKNKLFLATGFILTIIGGIFWVSYTFFDIGFTKSSYSTSIAILQFKNISSEDNSIFSEGLTEELISQLTKIKNLKVTPRRDIDRYKNNDKIKIKKIAEELEVEYIVDGSVRISSGHLRINATLINTLESKVIWSDIYNDNSLDILKVQDKIAQQIISELNQKISKDPLLDNNLGGIHGTSSKLVKSLAAMQYVSMGHKSLQDTKYTKVENAKYIDQFLIRAIQEDSTYGESYALRALAKFILINNISDTRKIDAELAEVKKNIEIALHYDKDNILAKATKDKLASIVSLRDQVDHNMKYDREVLNIISDELLDIAAEY